MIGGTSAGTTVVMTAEMTAGMVVGRPPPQCLCVMYTPIADKKISVVCLANTVILAMFTSRLTTTHGSHVVSPTSSSPIKKMLTILFTTWTEPPCMDALLLSASHRANGRRLVR